MLSALYSEMQKMNGLESKAEPGTHLCIDVEDAVSTWLLAWFVCAVIGCAFVVSFLWGCTGICRWHLQPEGPAGVMEQWGVMGLYRTRMDSNQAPHGWVNLACFDFKGESGCGFQECGIVCLHFSSLSSWCWLKRFYILLPCFQRVLFSYWINLYTHIWKHLLMVCGGILIVYPSKAYLRIRGQSQPLY